MNPTLQIVIILKFQQSTLRWLIYAKYIFTLILQLWFSGALVDSWFMMSSPMPILAVVVSYLFFLKIGTRLMKNRPPLQLTTIVSYYNAGQVVLATVLCIKVTFKDC